MKASSRGLAAIFGAVVFLVFAALPARAEQEPGKGREAKGGEDTLEALLIVSLKRDLGLDTAPAVDLAAKVRPLLEERRDFARQQARLRHEMTDNLKAAAPDTAAIDKQIRSAFELRAAFVQSQEKAFMALSAGMDPVLRGKLFVSLEVFDERVRKQLRRFQEGGRQRRGGVDREDKEDM